MSNKIKGLTIEIGGETTALSKSLVEVNKTSRDLKSELKDVERLLKLDPTNTELLNQKQQILAESVGNTAKKLETLKEAERQAQEQFSKGELAEEQYRAIQREVIKTEEELKNLNTQLKQMDWQSVTDRLDKFGNKAVDIGEKLTTRVTLPILGIGVAAFKFAADLEDAFGATDQIFKGSAEDVKTWADELQSYYGIAETEALSYANVMGAMLQNIGGLSEAEAAKQSKMLIELAGDLSAMFGGTTQSAVHALTGALKGNNTMLDNYGMGVNEATIKTKALEMGLIAEGDQMTLTAKQAATLALIMEQTGEAQGQAAREADGASGSMKSLVTELKNLATEIGEVLLPIITPFITKLKELAQKFKELSPETKEMIVAIGLVVAAIGPFLVVIGKMSIGLSALIKEVPLVIGFFAKLGGVAGVASTATGTLAAAFAFITGPIGLTIAAIAAVIAIVVFLVKNFDGLKDAAKWLWEGIKDLWDKIVDWTKKTFEKVVDTIKDNFKKALDFIKGLPKEMLQMGKDIIQGLIDGIKEKFSAVTDAMRSITSGITNTVKNILGIKSPSTVFRKMGENVGDGFALGIKDTMGRLKGVSVEMTNSVMPDMGSMRNNNNVTNQTRQEVLQDIVVNIKADDLDQVQDVVRLFNDLRPVVRAGVV